MYRTHTHGTTGQSAQQQEMSRQLRTPTVPRARSRDCNRGAKERCRVSIGNALWARTHAAYCVRWIRQARMDGPHDWSCPQAVWAAGLAAQPGPALFANSAPSHLAFAFSRINARRSTSVESDENHLRTLSWGRRLPLHSGLLATLFDPHRSRKSGQPGGGGGAQWVGGEASDLVEMWRII
jgi:hypothetical protein